MNIYNIIYLIIYLVGLFIPNLIIVKCNLKDIDKKALWKYFIVFYVCFFIGSKIFHIILDEDYENILSIREFICSGYTFFGGYIGSVLGINIYSRILNQNNKKIIFNFINNLNLMYAILKLGCLINGCCYGFTNIPIQLIESIFSFLIYFGIIILYYKNISMNKLLGLCIILFSLLRLIVSFKRAYMTTNSFYIIEVICLILVIYGIYIFLKKDVRDEES